ncbi:MAG: histidinol-phosphatase HisJ family protein [Bacteroidetes bacterium]|nr:histidinol-phosphatase HisJ family protein [Bacteroidota bacterium]
MIDYHTHSEYSDGIHTYNDLIQSAIGKGIEEIGFSDHLCLHYPEWAVPEAKFDNLKQDIIALKNMKSPLNIKFGLEVDYIEGKENEVKEYIEKFPVDYIIGSVHYINSWNFDTNPADYKNIDIDSFYRDYYRLIQKAARSELFDIMGHIDVPKKFGHYPSFKLEPFYKQTAKVFAESDVVIEINTGGLDKPCGEFYPGNDFLKECYLQNVPVTLGSDAHSANEVARYFDQAVTLLKQIGYKQIAVFTNRNRSFKKI